MLLRTLGGLYLDHQELSRPKPLLLLAYLALQGPCHRRDLAQLFWPQALHPATSLRVALGQIRSALPGVLIEQGNSVGTNLPVDVALVRRALVLGDLHLARRTYTGTFLTGLDLALGEELEEWLLRTREGVADALRAALLGRARERALEGQGLAAADLIGEALELAGGSALDPEQLADLYRLVHDAHHPVASRLKTLAAEFSVRLRAS